MIASTNSSVSSETTCDQTKKVTPNPFSMLVNSYLLRYSMTPDLLKQMARDKRYHENRMNNLWKATLHKRTIRSLKDWQKQKDSMIITLPHHDDIPDFSDANSDSKKRKNSDDKENEPPVKRQQPGENNQD